MIYAGILAGGKGTRMGVTDLPKQFLDLGSKPIIIHTIEKFLLVPEFDKIILGINPDWVSYTQDLIDKYLINYSDKIILTEGGVDRNKTIENIISKINEIKVIVSDDILLTHDAVRPFVSIRIIRENINSLSHYDAVDTVVEATDTIVESLDNLAITNIPERKFLYQGQTPQTFRIYDFLELYSNLNEEQKETLTDACKIFVINNKKVGLVKGEYSNIKITTTTDLKIARSMIEEI